MIRTLFAGAAVLAVLSSGALAQTMSDPSAPPGGSYSQTTTQRSTDAYGNTTEKSDSYRQNQATAPDGTTTTTTSTRSQSSSSGMAPPPPPAPNQ